MALTKVTGDLVESVSGSQVLNTATPMVIGCDCKNNAGTPNTQFDLDADIIVLRSSGGSSVVRYNPGAAITNNISTAGSTANGRDQAGAFTNSTFVHFYWIWNGATLATLSSATAPPTGPTLPSGYTHWAYAGAGFVDGSGNLKKIRIKGSWVHYEAKQAALNDGSSTSEVAVDLSGFVPANALSIHLNTNALLICSGSGGARYRADLKIIAGTVFATVARVQNTTSQAAAGASSLVVPNVSRQVYYQWTNEAGAAADTLNLDVDVSGYKVANGGE